MKTLNFKIEEELLQEFKKIVKEYHENASEVLRGFVREYVEEKKNDIYYKLISHEEASKSETEEIIKEINKLSDEHLKMETVEVVEL
jgi:metal-responsive CopG/Arc/MetJ family transcriptional regulator